MIYFLKRADGLIKIGCTKNFYRRISTLKTEHGELTLLGWRDGDYGDEKDLHIRFADIRVEGEWFKPEAVITSYIQLDANHQMPPRDYVDPKLTVPYPPARFGMPPKNLNQIVSDLEDDLGEANAKLKVMQQQTENDRIEIIKLQSQVKLMIELYKELQDRAIETATKIIREEKERQLKIVS